VLDIYFFTFIDKIQGCANLLLASSKGSKLVFLHGYLDDLMAHGSVQERDSKGLLAFIQKLRGVVTVLKDNGFENELRSGVILGNLLGKLP